MGGLKSPPRDQNVGQKGVPSQIHHLTTQEIWLLEIWFFSSTLLAIILLAPLGGPTGVSTGAPKEAL